MERIDHYGDGLWYDAEYVHIRGDISYYASVGRRIAGPILELACGTGRLTLPMAEAGASVHGIDRAPAMIGRAVAKRAQLAPEVCARVSFAIADMRTFRAERTFDAVVLGFNTLMHMLTDQDLEAALATVCVHLCRGGRFFFDVHTPLEALLERDPAGRYDPQQMIDPHTQHRYIVTESSRYDAATQINTMRFYYQRVDREAQPIGPERYTEFDLRILFPDQLDRTLARSGLKIVDEWSDFEGTPRPPSGSGGRRVMVAALR